MKDVDTSPTPPTPPTTPVPASAVKPGRKLSTKLLIGCGIGCGSLILLAVAGIVALGIGIESGALPDTAAQPHGKIPASVPTKLIEWEILDPDEEILYFYSAGLFSIKEDGNLFTDRRVVSYDSTDDGLQVSSAEYDRIVKIELDATDNWIDDSVITIYTTDGEWFVLLVSAESDRDQDFYRKLRHTWESKRGVPSE